MKKDKLDFEIKHKENDSSGMFFMEDENGIVSELTYYFRDNDIMVVNHTETRQDLQGNGLASRVLDHVVNYVRENNIKIDPVCPFVAAKFDETESYQDVRA